MRQGFSLLELSIVLVIIGLITGGIMAGRSMVRAAELRSVMSDVSKYKAAVNTFREKYNGYPGDLNNAVRYWGAQAGATTDGYDATCGALTAAATGTATCNGNADGMEGGTAATYYERFRFWQHLANAGLIEGQYSGVQGPGGVFDSVIGVNCPQTKINGGAFSIDWRGNVTGAAWWFDGSYGNWVRYGAVQPGANDVPEYPIFRPAEAYQIDSKMDDGLPAYGTIVTAKNGATPMPSCSTTTSSATAAYNITLDSLACSINFTNFF